MFPTVCNPTETLGYVRQVVHRAVNKKLKDDELICDEDGSDDGMQYAASIRNSFIRDICQERKGAAELISRDFVYENPTISGLAKQLMAIISISPAATANKLRDMEAMVTELSSCFPEHRPHKAQQSSGEMVLVTGTTGGLGSQLLACLVTSPQVSHVYALNRKSPKGDKSLQERQTQAFIERGLDIRTLDSYKVTLIEGDSSTEDLSIDPVLYCKIRDNITLVIINAWMVHHALPLKSFQPNIRSVRNLIDLTLRSPLESLPRIIFTSSVTVFKNWNVRQGLPLEAPIDDAVVALGSGYAESKLVGERILENAAKSTPLRPIIVRIGQLTGGSNGAWNCGDWVPAIVKSGQDVGVLPTRSGPIGWLSSEIAAQAIFDFRHSESQYLHLAHPNPALWSDVFEVFSSHLKIPLVSWDEWMARLEGNERGRKFLRLREYYGAWFYPLSLRNKEAPGIMLMDLQQGLRSSPTLADPLLPQVCGNDAEKWIRHWRMVGFLSNNDA